MTKHKKKIKKSAYLIQLLIVLSVISSVLFSALSILLAVGMLPTLVAFVVDKTKGKARAMTIGFMNFAGCCPFLMEIYNQGNNIETAIDRITDPETIVIIYCAAGVGYLIDWAMTGIVSSIIVQKEKKRLKDIEKLKSELIERWGVEVTGTIPLDEYGFSIEANKATEQDSPVS